MLLILKILFYFCITEKCNIHGTSVSNLLQPSVSVSFPLAVTCHRYGNGNVDRGFCFCSMQTHQVAIPKTLLSLISADSKTLKPMTVFYMLKNLYKGGTINRIRGRYNEIADVLGISESKLRKDLKWLYKENLAYIGQGGELRLASNKTVFALFKASATKRKFGIPFKSNKRVELHIKALNIHQSLESQTYTRDVKLLNKYVHSSTLKAKMEASVINFCLKEESQRAKSIEEVIKPTINLQITLSRKGISKRFGCVSSSTGTRLMTKLKKERLISKDEKNLVKLFDCNYQEMLSHKYRLRAPNMVYKDGAAWLVSSNLIEVEGFQCSVQ